MALSQLAFTQTAEAQFPGSGYTCESAATGTHIGSWLGTCPSWTITSTKGTYNGAQDTLCVATGLCTYGGGDACNSGGGDMSGGNCNNTSYHWLLSSTVQFGGPWLTNCGDTNSWLAVLNGYISGNGSCGNPLYGPAAANPPTAGQGPTLEGFVPDTAQKSKITKKEDLHTTPKQIQKAK